MLSWVVIRLGKGKPKKRDNLPDVLPWEERHSESSNRKRVAAILVLCLLCLGVGFSVGFQTGHVQPSTDPPTSSNNNSNVTTTAGHNSTTLTPASNVTGLVFLPSWMITGQNSFLGFYNAKDTAGNPVITQRADLHPTYSSGSGWLESYWLWLPSNQQWNVTCSSCSPLKQVDVTFNPDNTISFSVNGKTNVTPQGATFKANFECGII